MSSVNRVMAVLIVIIMFSSACAQVKKGEPAAARDYSEGILRTSYDRDVLGTYEAAVKAMTDLGMTIRSSDKDQSGGFIEATRPDDMVPVVVNLKILGRNATAATIQVGTGGDEPYSRIVAKRIGARLKG